ncbi:MAG: sigma-54 dependent transcriptional regulator [Terracidiphilus sp.]
MTMKTATKTLPQIAALGADATLLHFVERMLSDRYRVNVFTAPAELNARLQEPGNVDLLLMDWQSGNGNGNGHGDALARLAGIRAIKPSLPIVLFARSVDLKDVLQAARLGASDVILKPFGKSDVDHAVELHLANNGSAKLSASEDIVQEIPLDEDTTFVLSSKRMHELEAQCRLVARTDIPVLILGESGTGKEVATLFIHKMSSRSNRSFLKVNCAAMPADLLESELFGYEQGAFTGAVKAKPGKFELCNGGTIFLDEIGEMPAALQAKLLQVLQDGSFARLGGRYTMRVNVRVIAATNVDIKEAIAQKRFREDLYYRLNGFTLKMPPLRERTEEVPVFAHYFMRKTAGKHGSMPLHISPMLMQALCNYHWPGNLRELENIIKRYFILSDEQAIMCELRPTQFASSSNSIADTAFVPGLKRLVKSIKGDAESVAIAQALEGTGWNRKAAANQLQISYKALLYKIKQYNLSPIEKQQRPSAM